MPKTTYPAPVVRNAPLDMSPEEFREIGHALIDQIAGFYAGMKTAPVAPDEPLTTVRNLIREASLADDGQAAAPLVADTMALLEKHSVRTGHPRFWAYVNGAASPLGVLGDLMASAIDPNVASWPVGPAASEIERQTVRWVAQMIGLPADTGGLLVSGGAMANYLGLLSARRALCGDLVRTGGLAAQDNPNLRIYATRETHAWLVKGMDVFGMGTDAIHWVETDNEYRMRMDLLRSAVAEDRAAGFIPLMIVGSAGTVSTGSVDPLDLIADFCTQEQIWFHVDGAYGGLAAISELAPDSIRAIGRADSAAVDPHKWMYVPFEAAIAFVRDKDHLTDAFTYTMSYYPDRDEPHNVPTPFRDWGLQSSRGFRALKVWLNLKRAGAAGYKQMISDDIALAQYMHGLATQTDGLDPLQSGLSVCNFRYIPAGWSKDDTKALNDLNENILKRLQASGIAYPSHAKLNGVFAIRVCITNFRTQRADLDLLAREVLRLGQNLAE